jgi:hypothetical protein
MQIISRHLRQDKITVFNGIAEEADNNFRWQATVIEGVRVEKGRSMLLRERGIESTDKALLIIDLRDYKATEDRKYVNAKEWEQYGEEEKKGAWTINSSVDFFIPGVVSGSETVTMVGIDTEGQSPDFVSGVVCLGKEQSSKGELMNKYEAFSITDLSEEKGSGGDVIILRAAAK